LRHRADAQDLLRSNRPQGNNLESARIRCLADLPDRCSERDILVGGVEAAYEYPFLVWKAEVDGYESGCSAPLHLAQPLVGDEVVVE